MPTATSPKPLHFESRFEDDIVAHLEANGWLTGGKEGYDAANGLLTADVVAWVKETQPTKWAKAVAEARTEAAAAEALAHGLRKDLFRRGTLAVLREGFDVFRHGRFAAAEFKAQMDFDAEDRARYAANRLRVEPRVKHSVNGGDEIDLILFLNGIPVATAELKTDLTQSIGDAVEQYRLDRHPHPSGGDVEPLLSFRTGALVHFAVSTSEVRMTTRLEGAATKFLPFNRGNAGAAGNPTNPQGHSTAYLWEEVWQRDGWLDLLGRWLVEEKDGKGETRALIFPRYHQLDGVRRLLDDVREHGPGRRYLVQHSAGSGKTKSIAWAALLLSELHDDEANKVFESVIVVSDRRVIDGQLRRQLLGFERKSGVVATIEGKGAPKSEQLRAALDGSKKVVVCTLQTFPFALAEAGRLGKRFAVVADEAHSSQSGKAAAAMKEALGAAPDLAAAATGGPDEEVEVSSEELLEVALSNRMTARAGADGDASLTFVAFTATPKAKTLELFGTVPDADRPAGSGNEPRPFHVYPMRQAIEEGFILDVLRNYTPYKVAFQLARDGEAIEDVDEKEAGRQLMRFVRLHPYNIRQKVEVVVEHHRRVVAPLLGGRGRSMVVTGSRLEAVRWQLAVQQLLKEKRATGADGYDFASLVAFSGEVADADLPGGPYRETSATLNPGLKGRPIEKAFAAEGAGGERFGLLLVADKFQTGFDEPLLCGMYVDKPLSGVAAVQTLSRLNRARPADKLGPKKTDVFVLDFLDQDEEVLAAFKRYHETAELAGVSDPELVLDMAAELEAGGWFQREDVEAVAAVLSNPGSKSKDLAAVLEPIAAPLLAEHRTLRERRNALTPGGELTAVNERLGALEDFKRKLGQYHKAYTFLSQVFDYRDTRFEKLALLARPLERLLKFGRERAGVDLSGVELTHHVLKNRGQKDLALSRAPDPGGLEPLTAVGTSGVRERKAAPWDEVLGKINDLFSGELTEDDKVRYVKGRILGKLLESETLRSQAAGNTKQQFEASPDLGPELDRAVLDALEADGAMSAQVLNDPATKAKLLSLLLGDLGLQSQLKDAAG